MILLPIPNRTAIVAKHTTRAWAPSTFNGTYMQCRFATAVARQITENLITQSLSPKRSSCSFLGSKLHVMWSAAIHRATIAAKLHNDSVLKKMSGTQTCMVRLATTAIWDCEENQRDSILVPKTPDVNRELQNQIYIYTQNAVDL